MPVLNHRVKAQGVHHLVIGVTLCDEPILVRNLVDQIMVESASEWKDATAIGVSFCRGYRVGGVACCPFALATPTQGTFFQLVLIQGHPVNRVFTKK